MHKITVAGNMLADIVKVVEKYPDKGMLSTITSLSRAVGGCVPNTAIDLKTIDPSLSVNVLGRVGQDEYGDYILGELQRHGIDISGVRRSALPTSFSDVITIKSTGERTFFTFRGANGEFCADDIDIASLGCEIFHIGYIMLMDAFDRKDKEYGTALARFMKALREQGIKTSFDCVSESSGEFREKVVPVLRYTSYAILNEIESAAVSGIPARNARGELVDDNIIRTMSYFLQCGVSEKVVIHAPEAGYLMDVSGYTVKVPSLDLPKGFIKGSVGAGDAFCAGCLYGFLTDMPDKEVLRFAAAAAASSLSKKDAVSGMGNKVEILALDSCFRKDPL